MTKSAMKTCSKCGIVKPITEFYKNHRTTSGHVNKCKDCTKSDVRKYRRDNPSVQERDRMRGSRQPAGYLREYREKYPKKYAAHNAVNNAVRDGRLHKGSSCEICGSSFSISGHHDDYNRPLEVRWLCSLCHCRWHAENGEALNPF